MPLCYDTTIVRYTYLVLNYFITENYSFYIFVFTTTQDSQGADILIGSCLDGIFVKHKNGRAPLLFRCVFIRWIMIEYCLYGTTEGNHVLHTYLHKQYGQKYVDTRQHSTQLCLQWLRLGLCSSTPTLANHESHLVHSWKVVVVELVKTQPVCFD